MHKIFSKENIGNLIFIVVGVTVAVIFVIPFARKFVPKASTTSATTPSA